MKAEQFVVILGQCGYGKTTTVNRLLGSGWTTSAATTGTFLPHIKVYQDISDIERNENVYEEEEKKPTCEVTMVPYVESRHDSSHLEESDDGLILHQQISQKVAWYKEKEIFSDRKLANGVKTLVFVDLMGIGDTLVMNQPYYEIYREFIQRATHVLWIVDATRRGYLEDELCLEEVCDSFGNVERFTIGLNKVDAIGLGYRESPNPVPTEKQLKLIEEKKSVVAQYFQKIVPNFPITEKDVIPFSAYFGWNFDALSQLFFE